MKRLENKVVIITGAAWGCGRAAMKLFAEEGAKVIGFDVDDKAMTEHQKEIEAEGLTAEFRHVDLTSEKAIKDTCAEVIEKYGKVDVLYSNAGANMAADADVLSLTEKILDFSFNLNFRAQLYASQAVIPSMMKNGGGSIILTSSGSSVNGGAGVTAYACAKGAVNTLGLFIATQYGKQNIRCNIIQPGMIINEHYEERMPKEWIDAAINNVNLLPRGGYPIDVAKTALYLASDDSQFISGATLTVDGGAFKGTPMITTAKADQ